MGEDLERLKRRVPLLEYLNRHHWKGHRVSTGPEFVGLCPLHEETHASFYVNAQKNLFYCHGCGRGGDLIRFVELSQRLSFRQTVAYLAEELAPTTQLLAHTAAFYQLELHRHHEGMDYLADRGVHDAKLIDELSIGYARGGGNLRAYLQGFGYALERVLEAGLINRQGTDTFSRRVIFPCRQQDRIVNLYGRSIGRAFPHRLLPRSKGGLFAWESVRHFRDVILVEGLFDLAVLWQAGFRNTTCAIGTHLTPTQLDRLCENPDRFVYIAFDQDENQAGQNAATDLLQSLDKSGLNARLVGLPAGHDPNSYFAAGATAQDFAHLLEEAASL